jgi:predicted DNA-binding transcriptional regulator AlpA
MNSAKATETAAKATKRTRTRKDTTVVEIAPQGLYRWAQIKSLLPISRETWRLRIKAGRAPKPSYEDDNVTAWRGADLIAWLDNPSGYEAAANDTAGRSDG